MPKELFVTIENKPGALLRMAKVLGKKINIEAISTEGLGDFAIVRMLVSDGPAAVKALRDHGYQVQAHDTLGIRLPNRPGELIHLCDALASEGINIESLFGTAGKSPEGYIFVRASDMEKARKVVQRFSKGAEG